MSFELNVVALSALETTCTLKPRAVGRGYYIERFQRLTPAPQVIGINYVIAVEFLYNRCLFFQRDLSSAHC